MANQPVDFTGDKRRKVTGLVRLVMIKIGHFAPVIGVTAIGLLIQGCTTENTQALHPRGDLTDQAIFGQYTVSTFRSQKGQGSWQVSRNGRPVRGGHGWVFRIGRISPEEDGLPADCLGKDINGNGIPDIVIYEWTGGAHARFIARVVELERHCRLLAEIDGIDSVPRFRDLNSDGVLEIVLQDKTYRYWPGCYAESPAPTVVLRWNQREYLADARLMSIPPPSRDEIKAKAERIAQDAQWAGDPSGQYSRWYIPQELFQTALDLMYGGHEEEGWAFIRLAWTPKYPIDSDLLEEMRALMDRSPYWKEIKKQRASSKSVQATK